MKIAIVGTNGIPASYGGFETLVEYIVEYLATKHEVTVYCSGRKQNITNYKGANLKFINLSANNFQSIFYDIISIIDACSKFDKILILGSSGTVILPLLIPVRKKFIFNFGGLDWERSKWSYFTKKFLKMSEAIGVYCSHRVIADNDCIAQYISNKYHRESAIIAYGGDQTQRIATSFVDMEKFIFMNKNYFLTVARIQKDNNIEMLLNSFVELKDLNFVLIGNYESSKYGKYIKSEYQNYPNIHLIDAIYDITILNAIRFAAKAYIHGHSAGGTNPALVESLFLDIPVIAFDNCYNRSTTNNMCLYFRDLKELKDSVNFIVRNNYIRNEGLSDYARSRYMWADISKRYEDVIVK